MPDDIDSVAMTPTAPTATVKEIDERIAALLAEQRELEGERDRLRKRLQEVENILECDFNPWNIANGRGRLASLYRERQTAENFEAWSNLPAAEYTVWKFGGSRGRQSEEGRLVKVTPKQLVVLIAPGTPVTFWRENGQDSRRSSEYNRHIDVEAALAAWNAHVTAKK